MNSSRKEFVAEAEELIEGAQRLVLEIQDPGANGPAPDKINALFRMMHTLKGISGLFNLNGISSLSHSLEALMDDIRLGRIEADSAVIKFMLGNIDLLRGMVEKVSRDEYEGDVSAYIGEIELFRGRQKDRVPGLAGDKLIDPSIMRVLSEYEEHRLRANVAEGKGIFMAKTAFPLETFDKDLEEIRKLIMTAGELIATLPTSSNVKEGYIGFNLMFCSQSAPSLTGKEAAPDIEVLLSPKSTSVKTDPPNQPDARLKSSSMTVRVDIEKLDGILNTVGELTLARSAIERISAELANEYGRDGLINDIHKITRSLERKLSDLKNRVLEIRMVPVGQIFTRLAQVVRRYSAETGKKIEFAMYGEDTEIDKYLAEEIVDPLMHLVRNAIDHGIEPPEERRRKGKDETGRLVLRAAQKGNHVVVELHDDGSGIDIGKIREKAIEKGLIVKDQPVDERKASELIFMPGFSTKDTVSEVSGRGVGLDVVKEKLSALGGFSEVESVSGSGCSFILTLPITLAIIKVLIVRIGDERFAVPLTSMSETLIIAHSDIQTIEQKEVYCLRGTMLPLVRVDRFLGIENQARDRYFVTVVGFGEKRVGLLVDELFGQQEVVIKSLGNYLKKIRGFAGAAEIGKYEVVLVLDVESIVADAVIRKGRSAEAAQASTQDQ